MQISFLKHLKLPETLPQLAPAREQDAAAPDAEGSNAAGQGAAARRAEVKAARDLREGEKPQTPDKGANSASPGVIVTISGHRHQGSADGLKGELVYTNKPSTPGVTPTPPDDPLADHFVGTKSEEFVHYAVSTMRQFAEEQERARAVSRPDGAQDDQGVHLIPRNLGDIQKLASRFKLFA